MTDFVIINDDDADSRAFAFTDMSVVEALVYLAKEYHIKTSSLHIVVISSNITKEKHDSNSLTLDELMYNRSDLDNKNV